MQTSEKKVTILLNADLVFGTLLGTLYRLVQAVITVILRGKYHWYSDLHIRKPRLRGIECSAQKGTELGLAIKQFDSRGYTNHHPDHTVRGTLSRPAIDAFHHGLKVKGIVEA